MEKSAQLNTNFKKLDLRDWWIQVNNMEEITNIGNKWKYRWYNKDKTYITTIKNWIISNYKINETKIIFDEKIKKAENIKQKTKSETLIDLFLSPTDRAKDIVDAYEKAKQSDKSIFWFVSKWLNKAIIVLDFSGWKKPKKTVYPLNKYNIKTKITNIKQKKTS